MKSAVDENQAVLNTMVPAVEEIQGMKPKVDALYTAIKWLVGEKNPKFMSSFTADKPVLPNLEVNADV